jgi:hypothetical protein
LAKPNEVAPPLGWGFRLNLRLLPSLALLFEELEGRRPFKRLMGLLVVVLAKPFL